MPIKIPSDLPASKILEQENIFVMNEERASTQQIRPLEIAILNLMPKKIETETQLLRLLGNTPIHVNIDLVQTATHTSRNTSAEHLLKFYKTFEDIKNNRYDGLIITGAPVEQIPFEDVDYWPELCEIMKWSTTHVYSTFHICWGAQAGLYYHYGIGKHLLPDKMFGIFDHDVLLPRHPLLRGFNEHYFCPHSRHTSIDENAVLHCDKLQVLTRSKIAGINLIASTDGKRFFATGHHEYDRNTLHDEFQRDYSKGLAIKLPYNYYPGNDCRKQPEFNWRAHANLLFTNWLNFVVYQDTPYDLRNLDLQF